MPAKRFSPARLAFCTLAALSLLVDTAPAVLAGSQRFDSRIIVVGKEREKLKNTPIEKRPDRPLHIYGNAVRRRSGR